MSEAAKLDRKMAGPVVRGGELAQVMIEAIEEDNPEKEIVVDDHGSYVRIEADGGLTIRRQTLEDILGRQFRMQELEMAITSFSGKIDVTEDSIRWYFKAA